MHLHLVVLMLGSDEQLHPLPLVGIVALGLGNGYRSINPVSWRYRVSS